MTITITRHRITCLILFVTLLNSSALQSQQTNFIHIQSDANQPFAVQLKGLTYSSSTTGYLVIPQVPAGEHTLLIGFAGNNFPEYNFQCTMADKPRGFSLKQGVDNSWTLFDMVDFTVIRGALNSKETAKAPELTVTPSVVEKIADSAAVKTADLNIQAKAKPTIPSTSSNIAPEVAKAAGGVATDAVSGGVLAATAVTGVVVNKSKLVTKQSSILKIFDKASSNGIDQVYVVVNNGKADTIALFIPVLKDDLNKQAAFNRKSHPISNHKVSIEEVSDILNTKPNRLQILTK